MAPRYLFHDGGSSKASVAINYDVFPKAFESVKYNSLNNGMAIYRATESNQTLLHVGSVEDLIFNDALSTAMTLVPSVKHLIGIVNTSTAAVKEIARLSGQGLQIFADPIDMYGYSVIIPAISKTKLIECFPEFIFALNALRALVCYTYPTDDVQHRCAVPSHWTELERNRIRGAMNMLGVECSFIEEPCAAMVYHLKQSFNTSPPTNKFVICADMGHYSTDVWVGKIGKAENGKMVVTTQDSLGFPIGGMCSKRCSNVVFLVFYADV